MFLRTAFYLVLTVLLTLPAAAQDYQKGLAAIKRGDYKTALREWRPLAEQGSAQAQRNLGLMYLRGQGVRRNYKTAAKWFTLAAKQGNARAQNSLGLMYGYGQGVPQDDKTALKWWLLAAKQGHATAQCNVAKYYRIGRGVPQDYAEAAKWYRIAAEQGSAVGQKNLGVMYKRGLGVPQDDTLAVKWFRKAAERGERSAQVSLAMSYDKGHGVPKDYAEAAKWYREAAKRGQPLAQFELGRMHAEGRGVPKDNVSAYFWLNLVAKRRTVPPHIRTKLTELLGRITKEMTAEQLAKANQLTQRKKDKPIRKPVTTPNRNKVATMVEGCHTEKTARSVSSRTATKMHFANNSGETIKIFWLDYKGKRKKYRTLRPGESYTQRTFMTHPWVVTDVSEKCVGLFLPGKQTTEIAVE